MPSTLSAAQRIDRAVRVGAAERRAAVPGGVAIWLERLPAIDYLNAVLLDAPLDRRVGFDELAALADRCHPHALNRMVVLDDAGAAGRLAAEFERAGWERHPTLFMDWCGGRPELDPRAEQVSEQVMRHLQRRVFQETRYPPGAPEGLAAMLVEAQSTLRAGTRSLCYAAGEDGLQSIATLFIDEDDDGVIAMVEAVATLCEFRGRGLASAAVRAAVDGARRAGAERVVVPTDAEDWPQLLYARLGFEALGTSVTFRRPGGSGPRGV